MAQFTDKDWETVLSAVSAALGKSVADSYKGQKIPKLIAAIPYLSGSEDPDRFAVSNLMTYYGAAKASSVFDHRVTDDEEIYRRLATFHVGEKADQKTVQFGLDLLALASISDHEHDLDADKKAGKYNPISAGKLDAQKTKVDIEKKLLAQPKLAQLYAPVYTTELAKVAGIWQ